MPKFDFALVFSHDPSAKDVVREDAVIPLLNEAQERIPLQEGQDRKVIWIKNKYVRDKKKQVSEIINCKILCIGE